MYKHMHAQLSLPCAKPTAHAEHGLSTLQFRTTYRRALSWCAFATRTARLWSPTTGALVVKACKACTFSFRPRLSLQSAQYKRVAAPVPAPSFLARHGASAQRKCARALVRTPLHDWVARSVLYVLPGVTVRAPVRCRTVSLLTGKGTWQGGKGQAPHLQGARAEGEICAKCNARGQHASPSLLGQCWMVEGGKEIWQGAQRAV